MGCFDIFSGSRDGILQILTYTYKYIILSEDPKQLVMTSNQNSHFGQFMLPFSQLNYNFIQIRPYQSIQTLQTETNLHLKKHNLQSFNGKGKWTFNQQKQYLLFLNRNMQEMREKSTRKLNKVFLKMSQEVKSRTADQCRSHHQKVLKYHDSLQEIIRYYTEDVYSFEKIFGSKGSLPKKQALSKTSAQIQNQQSCNIRVEGRTFKIVLKVQQIADY